MNIEQAIHQTSFRSETEKMVVNLIYTGNWILGINAKALKPLGLTTQQYNVLRILKGQYPEPAPVSLVSERMLDKMSNASRLIEKLRQKNLVERTVCKHDRRQVDVKLTEQGISVLEEANKNVGKAAEAFQQLSQQEAATLNTLLDKLRSNAGPNLDE